MVKDIKNKIKLEQPDKKATKPLKVLKKLFNINLTDIKDLASKGDQKKDTFIAVEDTTNKFVKASPKKETEENLTNLSSNVSSHRAKREIGKDTTTTQIPTSQPVPQLGVVTHNAQAQRAVVSNDIINKEFGDLDKMLESFSNGINSQTSNNSKFKSELNEIKQLIETFEKEAISLKPKLFDLELYSKMYDTLAESEQLKTSKKAFLENAKAHQLNKIARSKQDQTNISSEPNTMVNNNPHSNEIKNAPNHKSGSHKKEQGRSI